ncbi:MAG: transcription elongation factor GreA [Bdellovibrionota bacterium]|jgi:transcription elongation factor GreA
MKKTMTPRGHAALREELRQLKALRPEIAKAIEIARGHGDLSENGDYDAAKNRSGITEAKIRECEALLSQVEIIDPKNIINPKKVTFGVTVRIEDVDSGEEKVLGIYGSEESDISKGWISYESPLGRALIGKEEGETVIAKLPGGNKEYEIQEIYIDYDWTPQE